MKIFTAMLVIIMGISAAGCMEEERPEPVRTSTRPQLIPVDPSDGEAAAAQPLQPGIQLDPALTSATGTPAPEEMPVLIALQAKVSYPVLVPTQLPGGYRLDADLASARGPTASDPVGYHSFRFSDPSNPSRVFTFNQTPANSKPLGGYYLTEEQINGVDYQIYWHRSLEYLSESAPVRTYAIEEAETFVVMWKGLFINAAGEQQEVHYGLSTGSYTGHGWGDIKAILRSLKPLESINQ
ncbi:MAG: hypothetical protein IBX61_01405 [Thermoleophilia bacterium]|nr:hypothetical protein [Thermoleophilia bacterium]